FRQPPIPVCSPGKRRSGGSRVSRGPSCGRPSRAALFGHGAGTVPALYGPCKENLYEPCAPRSFIRPVCPPCSVLFRLVPSCPTLCRRGGRFRDRTNTSGHVPNVLHPPSRYKGRVLTVAAGARG